MVEIASILFLAILGWLLYPQIRHRYAYNKWHRSLRLHSHEAQFHKLFHAVNGFQLSKRARRDYDLTDYVYGEIEFLPFIALMSAVKTTSNDVFYDLGSGIGKAVIAYALVFPMKKAVGVEVLDDLHQAALQCKQQLVSSSPYHDIAQSIDFLLGDFLQIDLNDATIIFINATTLYKPTWEALCQRIVDLPSAHTVVTTGKPLTSGPFKIIKKVPIMMSWGVVDVYIQQKNN